MCCTGSLKYAGRKNSTSVHHRTTLAGYIFAPQDVSTIGKKLVKQQYMPHMSSQYGDLRLTSGWDRLPITPANFNGFRVLASLLHRRRSTELKLTKVCRMFGCLLC